MKRWFSLALVLAMCLTTALGDVAAGFAEETEIVDVETVDTYGSEETAGDDWLPVDEPEDAEAVEAEPEAEGALGDAVADETPEIVAIDDEQPQAEPASDVEDVQAEAPAPEAEAPELWYARANSSITLEIDETVSRNIPKGSILLVTEKPAEGMLHVACENLSGTVDAALLEALSDEEVQVFMDGLTEVEVSFYQDLLDYPLPPEPAEVGVEPEEIPVDAEEIPEEATGDEEVPEEAETEDMPEAEDADEAIASEDASEDEAVEESDDDEPSDETEEPETASDEATDDEPEAAAVEEPAQASATPEPEAEKTGDMQEPAADAAVEAINDAVDAAQDADPLNEVEELAVFNEAAEADTATTDATQPETAATGEPAVVSDGIPVGIRLSASSLVMGLRETYTGLTASVVDASGTAVEGQTVTWRSSNTNVVKVDAAGKLTAVRRGKATIIASAEGLPEATVTVIVRKATSKVTLTPKKGNLSVGMGLQLTAKLSKSSGSATLNYTSSNPAVATVDAKGLVTGVSAGKATITVRTFNKKKATCKVTVYPEPASVTTGKAEYAVLQGVTDKIAIDVKDAAGGKTYTNLKVVSSDPNVVAVDDSGNFTGVSYGSAIVTITTHNGLSTSCAVDVCGQAADMTLSAERITIGVKENYNRMSYTLTPPEGQEKCAAVVTWKSRNKKIAKVNATTGVITGVKAGTTTIVATTNNGISKRVTVVVKKAPKSVSVSPEALNLTPGMTGMLVASYDATSVNDNMTYTSSDAGVAVVDNTGLVTAVGRGTATITAKTYNGKKGTCTVTVTDPPAQVLVNSTLTIAVGMSGKLECSALDANGLSAMADYSYTAVEETGAVTVNENGEVTGVRMGTARVKVSTHNGVTTHLDALGNAVETECVVTIVDAPTEIRMVDSVEITVGESYSLKPRLYTSDGMETDIGSFDIATNDDCITLDGDGTITGIGAGTATVTATSFNGLTATCQVKVTRRYRMYAIYSYYNVAEKGSLTFPKNNATSFQEVMAKSNISGITYENLGIQANEPKSSLLSKLKKAFSDSRDGDVNLIYMCSHGTNYVDVPKTSSTTHYGFQLPGYSNYNSSSEYYLTSREIFDAISAIKGQVVLVLDSCYSGQFIVNMKSSLDNEGGRISVMTAATNTTACYYNIADTSRACDFFTLYLLMGAGYDMRTHVDTGSYPADTNKDGKLTFTEMFNYAKKTVKANVPNYKNKSWFHGNASQTPYVYTGDNGSLVLFQYN